MKVTEKDVAYVADLANLELSGEERAGMVRDLNSILDYIERLNELDTSNVEPMAQVLFESPDALRDDLPRPTLGTADAIANAPLAGAGYFKVPKVIER